MFNFSADAPGTNVLKRLPVYMEKIVTGEAADKDLLSVKYLFVEVVGWGLFIFKCLPDYEKLGSNLTIEAIYRFIPLFDFLCFIIYNL